MNTSEGMGVRSCGWIMERMEGRWPSLDPTKNSLWTQEQAVSLVPEPSRQGGQWRGPVLRPGLHPRASW